MHKNKFAEMDTVLDTFDAIRTYGGQWFTVRDISHITHKSERSTREDLNHLIDRKILVRELAPQDSPGGQAYRYRHVPRYPMYDALLQENIALKQQLAAMRTIVAARQRDLEDIS